MSATPTSAASSTPHHRLTPQPRISPPPGSPSSASTPAAAAAGSSSSGGGGGHPAAAAEKKRLRPALNVFSNDGSFLERFQRNKKEEEEKKKADEDIKRKREFDQRFRKRGKRSVPDEPPSSPTPEEHPSKRTKGDDDVSLTQYQQEVQSYAGRSLKDDGIGVRPLVK